MELELMLVSCWLIHLSHLITELQMHHLYFTFKDFMIVLTINLKSLLYFHKESLAKRSVIQNKLALTTAVNKS